MHGTVDDIRTVLRDYRNDSDSLFNQITDIAYFMGGGCDFNLAWCLSFDERNRIIERVNVHLKKQSGDTTEYIGQGRVPKPQKNKPGIPNIEGQKRAH